MITRKQLLITALYCFLLYNPVYAKYTPDILDGYEQQTIKMKPDYEGDVFCTLVRKPLKTEQTNKAVLYIHGYNDYFFQAALGDSVLTYGYDFYALDLRKYGRSIRPHQKACSCKEIDEYFADIDTALAIIQKEGHDHIILMAHSTGGLITPLYLNSRKNNTQVKSLILNSPFLDMNMSWFMEKIAIPVVSFIGKFFPNLVVEKTGFSSYAKSLLAEYNGEWTFNTNWKRPEGYPKTAGWIRAIHQGHVKIRKGLSIACPVLVLSSDKSFRETDKWAEEYKSSDIVLDISDIQTLGLKLGKNVSRDTVPNGIHDLILSRNPYRQVVYAKYKNWMMDGYIKNLR